MKTFNTARALAGALAGLAPGAASTHAHAAISDYAFQLVDKSVTVGPDTIISVRLVDTRTGKPVPDAVIIAMRLDMAPDGMADMASTVAPIPGSAPGVYRFKAKVSMAGGWRLSLAAKVQGEDGTVDQKLVFKADE
ncbi:hypothetical protein RHAL1_00297 [Beijerinckiaceae bacterium RH AL1]|nr:hypothetical protein RHAL1_00297 [Beijerinckiaceae bacterium RH AL1]